MINTRRAQLGEPPIDINQIPLNDDKAFAMLKAAQTTAVFQVESRGMKELILKMAPDNLEEMIALVALYRPGPLDSGMVQNFINRKHGREKVSYPDASSQHESLKPILESTYGIIVYQEQVMQIAQTLAGYTLGEADLLRRAMGKKKPEEMRQQRDVFAQGAAAQGIDADLAAHIFDLVEKFAGYGFNKSHSAAYALVSYQTLWLKAHYPAAFMAATMSSDIDHTAKVVVLLDECHQLGVDVLPPDVNQGQYVFTVNDQNQIVFGLGAVKGVGSAPVEAIVISRDAGGPFVDLFDFCARVDPKKMSKRVYEALIQSGALDSLGDHRAQLMAALPDALRAAEQRNENAAAGMTDLFGEVAATSHDGMSRYQQVAEWSLQERLAGEQATLGLYLTGHPIDEYERELKGLVACRLEQVAVSDQPQLLAGLVIDVRRVRTRQGSDMMFVTLDDRSARLELTLFPEADSDWVRWLKVGEIVIVRAEVTWHSHREEMRVRGVEVFGIAQARAHFAQHVMIEAPYDIGASPSAAQLFVDELQRFVASSQELPAEQRLPIQLWYRCAAADAMIQIDDQFALAMTDQNIHRLRHWLGEDQVKMCYQVPSKVTH
jgi:DNA polymerase-3 subunit alpha